MGAFKEQLKKDSEQTFFNLSEFAEMHMVDGKEIPVVVDEETFLELYLGKSADTEGVFEDSKMIFVQKKDIDSPPVIGQLIDFDGEIYPVGNVMEDYGGYAIVLKGNAG